MNKTQLKKLIRESIREERRILNERNPVQWFKDRRAAARARDEEEYAPFTDDEIDNARWGDDYQDLPRHLQRRREAAMRARQQREWDRYVESQRKNSPEIGELILQELPEALKKWEYEPGVSFGDARDIKVLKRVGEKLAAGETIEGDLAHRASDLAIEFSERFGGPWIKISNFLV